MLYEIRIKSGHLIAMHWSLKECVPQSDKPELLIECMEYVAKAEKQTKKEYKFKVDHDKGLIIYNCTGFVLENNLPPNEEQLPTFFVAMERLAQALDIKNMKQMSDKMSPLKMVKI